MRAEARERYARARMGSSEVLWWTTTHKRPRWDDRQLVIQWKLLVYMAQKASFQGKRASETVRAHACGIQLETRDVNREYEHGDIRVAWGWRILWYANIRRRIEHFAKEAREMYVRAHMGFSDTFAWACRSRGKSQHWIADVWRCSGRC